jgi:hypothetical protein
MITSIVPGYQGAVQVSQDDLFRALRLCSGNHRYAGLGEEALGSLPHSAGYDHIHALRVKPPRQKSRLMRGWNNGISAHDLLLDWIDLKQCKGLAVSEMHAKHALCSWNSYQQFLSSSYD